MLSIENATSLMRHSLKPRLAALFLVKVISIVSSGAGAFATGLPKRV
jgi:hypothetical protein